PTKTMLATQSEPKVRRFLENLKTPSQSDLITVAEGTCQRIKSEPCEVPARLNFEWILRIRRVTGEENRFRVWYVEPVFHKLMVFDNVLLSGTLQFTGSQVWDPQQNKLIDLEKHNVTLAVGQILDYIAGEGRIPRDVGF